MRGRTHGQVLPNPGQRHRRLRRRRAAILTSCGSPFRRHCSCSLLQARLWSSSWRIRSALATTPSRISPAVPGTGQLVDLGQQRCSKGLAADTPKFFLPVVKAVGVNPEQPLPPCHPVGTRSLSHQMKGITPQTPGVDWPVRFPAGRAESSPEEPPVVARKMGSRRSPRFITGSIAPAYCNLSFRALALRPCCTISGDRRVKILRSDPALAGICSGGS